MKCAECGQEIGDRGSFTSNGKQYCSLICDHKSTARRYDNACKQLAWIVIVVLALWALVAWIGWGNVSLPSFR